MTVTVSEFAVPVFIVSNSKPLNPLTGQPEFNGTSILDVTDPAHPKYLAHIPGQEGTYESGGAQMVRVCDGKTLPKGDPSAVYLLRPFGLGGKTGAWAYANLGVLVALAIGFVVTWAFGRAAVRSQESAAVLAPPAAAAQA